MIAQSRTWAADDFKRAKKQTAYARKSRRMARRTLEPVQVVRTSETGDPGLGHRWIAPRRSRRLETI